MLIFPMLYIFIITYRCNLFDVEPQNDLTISTLFLFSHRGGCDKQKYLYKGYSPEATVCRRSGTGIAYGLLFSGRGIIVTLMLTVVSWVGQQHWVNDKGTATKIITLTGG